MFDINFYKIFEFVKYNNINDYKNIKDRQEPDVVKKINASCVINRGIKCKIAREKKIKTEKEETFKLLLK
tara:strand:- start:80 stop:289 length:210 start_codon:yes stop_codon:yes gene_type:complete